MIIPLAIATDSAVGALQSDGYRITGRVINGVPCLIARRLHA